MSMLGFKLARELVRSLTKVERPLLVLATSLALFSVMSGAGSINITVGDININNSSTALALGVGDGGNGGAGVGGGCGCGGETGSPGGETGSSESSSDSGGDNSREQRRISDHIGIFHPGEEGQLSVADVDRMCRVAIQHHVSQRLGQNAAFEIDAQLYHDTERQRDRAGYAYNSEAGAEMRATIRSATFNTSASGIQSMSVSCDVMRDLESTTFGLQDIMAGDIDTHSHYQRHEGSTIQEIPKTHVRNHFRQGR